MKLFSDDIREKDIQWAKQIQSFLKQQGDEFNAKLIDNAIEMYQSRKITLVLVGLNKRGKSTFCNAWLGRSDDELAPVDFLPATGTVTKFCSDSQRENGVVTFSNGQEESIPYSQIRNYVTEEGNPSNQKQVDHLTVYGKFDMDPDVTLIDLPGDESIHSYHSQIVYNYLPHADVILFMSSADEPILASELQLLRKCSEEEKKKIFFIINKADMCEGEELAQAEAHDRKVLQNAGLNHDLYVISAQQVMNDQHDQFEFQRLFDAVKTLLSNPENKRHLQQEGFRRAVREAAATILGVMTEKNDLIQLSQKELEEKLQLTQTEDARIAHNLTFELENFKKQWESILQELAGILPDTECRVQNQVKQMLDAIPMMDVGKKTLSVIPEKISELVECEVHRSTAPAEEALRQLLLNMDQNMPELSKYISNNNYRIKVVSGPNSHIGSGVAGSAMILGGLGMASACSGTATALAGVPLIGGLLGAVGGAITAPLLVLGAPLVLAGSIFLTMPAMGWIRGKKRMKQELLEEGQAAVHAAFCNIREIKIPSLRTQGEQMIKNLRESMESRQKLLLQNLDELVANQQQQQTTHHEAAANTMRLEQFTELLKNEN